MKTSRILLVALLSAGIGLAGACSPDKVMGMVVPNPNTKPTTGTIPGGDPFNPDAPVGPDVPDPVRTSSRPWKRCATSPTSTWATCAL